ncbi:hypothetical protein EVAR_50352_1 [Eumeta japonica]|uniref:Uncharacterized protein n=1 Tax=Eumeta variegata TaxID=151549 RepID=A0A4C1Y0Y9_EUMVA|nr:hypothetical protein EVAR_50352_1 [Eumeta japonica]
MRPSWTGRRGPGPIAVTVAISRRRAFHNGVELNRLYTAAESRSRRSPYRHGQRVSDSGRERSWPTRAELARRTEVRALRQKQNDCERVRRRSGAR